MCQRNTLSVPYTVTKAATRMTRSLTLAAYMAYARRGAKPAGDPGMDRPEGELIWAHAADKERAEALCQIAGRLSQVRPGLHMVLTLADDAAQPIQTSATVLLQRLPEDTLASVTAFLDYWRPGLCLWTGGDLRPALLTCADERAIPLYLIDATAAQIDRSGWSWLPDPTRAVLRRFAQVQARSESAARSLRRLGLSEQDITVSGPLRTEALPAPYNEAERDELARILLGRPIWLAAHLDPDELQTMLEARRKVSRLSHRLILVICPETQAMMPEIAARLAQEDLRTATWSAGEVPLESCQVILGDPEGEMGLWFRLAPICFMGNSLMAGMTGRDPNEPAVHGSAILYGPNVRDYLQDYGRYAEARAARIVRDPDTLAAAVSQLIAPDQAAAMAHGAWDVASQAAEVNDRLLDLIQDTLDLVGGR